MGKPKKEPELDVTDDPEPEGVVTVNGVEIPVGVGLMTTDEKMFYAPALYEAGTSWEDIEEILQLNRRYISKAIKEAGIETRTTPKKTASKSKKQQPKKEQGMTVAPEFEPPRLPSVQLPGGRKAGGDDSGKKIYEQPLRVLDDSYAKLVGHLTQQVDWFVEALSRIGWSSMLIAFQTANISSTDAFEKLDQFQDSDEFVRFVNTYLQALWQVKDDAKAMVKLEETVRNQDLLLFAAGERIKQLEVQLTKAVITAKTALSSMNIDDLRRFAVTNAVGEMMSGGGNGWEVGGRESTRALQE